MSSTTIVDLKRKRSSLNQKKYSSKKYFGNNRKLFIKCGQKGFLATCNFQEKECLRECYSLLEEYADQLYGKVNDDNNDINAKISASVPDGESANPSEINNLLDHKVNIDNAVDDEEKIIEENVIKINNADEEEEEEVIEDISSILKKNISSLKNESATKSTSNKFTETRFQQVQTDITNLLFITTTLNDPLELGVKIIRDIDAMKKQKTRYLLRLIPVECICKANIEDIKATAGKLFDKHFLTTEPTTFSIVINKRYNKCLDRQIIIKELANLIAFKNANHKVNLTNSNLCVIVEIVKGLCCLSVVPEYNQLKKYNLIELANRKIDDQTIVSVN